MCSLAFWWTDSESWPNVEAIPQFFCEREVFVSTSNSTVLYPSNSSVLIYVVLNLFFIRRTQLFLYVEPNVFLVVSNSKCSTQLCSEFNQLRQRVLLFCILTSWKVPSVALSSIHTPWRVPLFCTLHSVQERHCILYQESTLLYQLWTLHYSAALKYRCAY